MAESVENVAFKKFSVYCNEMIKKNSIPFGWKINSIHGSETGMFDLIENMKSEAILIH